MAGKPKWKTQLLELRELRGQSGVLAYRRAKIIVELLTNRGFRDSIGAADDFAVAETLDAEVEDLALTALELRDILDAFPDEEQWKDGKLRSMLREAQERGKVQPSERPKRTVNRVTKKEFEQLQDEKRDLEARSRFDREQFEQRTQTLSEQLDELRSENERLREENAVLRGRVEELERLLERQSVAA